MNRSNINKSTSGTSITKQILDLQTKTLPELREIYKTLFPGIPLQNTDKNLIPKLAYRIQELALGGLSNSTKDKLQKMAEGVSPAALRTHTDLLPGTKICKEWNGVVHEVEVKKNGFEYSGQSFKSLSAIARKITGTRWNGPRFFKLRNGM